jgi:hypothetical protein
MALPPGDAQRSSILAGGLSITSMALAENIEEKSNV